MDSDAAMRREKTWLDLVVGVQVGVFGALASLACFSLISPLLGHPWWLIPNLFASHFYSETILRSGPGSATWTGVAVHVCTSGLIGAINGLITPGGRIFGLGVAFAWYLICYLFLWKRIAPLLLFSVPQPVLIAGWFLLGSTLGWHPWFLLKARTLTERTNPAL